MAEIYPLQLLIASLAGWMNRSQGEVLEYPLEENRVLKEQLKGRRLRLNDDQRRRLAARGKRLGRRLLMQVATIVTPDTILRWHKRLIAAKWTYAAKRTGRPGLMKEIRALIIRFARENCGWGYCRIEGALRNLGHRVAPTTIRKVLKEHGIKPAPDRPTTWRAFLKAHWDQIAGTDFFTTEVWTATGLRTYYVLFMIELDTRRAHLAGFTQNGATPHGSGPGSGAERQAGTAREPVRREDVLQYITSHPGSRCEDIAATVGADTKAVSSVLRSLRSKGKVTAEGQARGTRYFVGTESG